MGSSYYDQMHKDQASTSSKPSASSHNTTNNNSNSNSRSIATNTAKVLNKINTLVRPPDSFLKSRPSPKRPPPPPPPPPAERFQMVHTPDRAPAAIPMWEIPRTEPEYRAALTKMRMQDRLRVEGGEGDQEQTGEAAPGMGAGLHDRFPSGFRCVCDSVNARINERRKGVIEVPNLKKTPANPRNEHCSPRSVPSMHSLRVESATFERPRGGLTTSSSTPMVSTPASARFPPRVMSVEALRAPRPLSERALIPLGQRASRSEYAPEKTINKPITPVASPAMAPKSSSSGNLAEGVENGRTAIDSGTKAGRRTPRMWSFDSIATSDGEDAAESSRPGVPSARQTGASSQAKDTGRAAARTPGTTECYVCQEPCKPGAGLCAECKSRFQPLGEVFEDSESEYEDEPVGASHPAPERSPPAVPATPPRPGRAGDGFSPRAGARGASSRGSSGQSSASKRLRDLASRSTSVSPTPHLAHNMQLKVVPYPMIRQFSVGSSAREREEHDRSALYHIEQTMKPREPMTPGAAPGPGRDAIRVGSVHSGEGSLAGKHNGSPGERVEDAQQQGRSRSSYGDWFRYYEKTKEDEEGSGYVFVPYELVSPITNCDLFSKHRNRTSARSSTYDLIYSIYNEYCDQQEDEEHGGMI